VFPRVANSAQSEFDAQLSTVSWVAVAKGTEKAEERRQSNRNIHGDHRRRFGRAQDVGKPRQ
jgi:hypothetical protein